MHPSAQVFSYRSHVMLNGDQTCLRTELAREKDRGKKTMRDGGGGKRYDRVQARDDRQAEIKGERQRDG